jgi:hypothetical protein
MCPKQMLLCLQYSCHLPCWTPLQSQLRCLEILSAFSPRRSRKYSKVTVERDSVRMSAGSSLVPILSSVIPFSTLLQTNGVCWSVRTCTSCLLFHSCFLSQIACLVASELACNLASIVERATVGWCQNARNLLFCVILSIFSFQPFLSFVYISLYGFRSLQ